MNNTAVIYARVSSIGERQSNERQIEDLKILGKQKNYTIVKIYEEKISGAKKNVERPILTECLEYCFSKNIRILLISELSRLGRNVDEVLKMSCYARSEGLMSISKKSQIPSQKRRKISDFMAFLELK